MCIFLQTHQPITQSFGSDFVDKYDLALEVAQQMDTDMLWRNLMISWCVCVLWPDVSVWFSPSAYITYLCSPSPSLQLWVLNHSESNFPYSAKNLILSLMFFSDGFLTHLLDTKPTLDDLLAIVILERVLFTEVLNSVDSFFRLLFLSLRTVNFSRWSSLNDEALGLPGPFFLATLLVLSKHWPILLIADGEIGISSAFRVLYISE